MTTIFSPQSPNKATATQLKEKLQAWRGDRLVNLAPEVTLEFSSHIRFHCMDCTFVLSQHHLGQGVVHLLPEGLHDFNEDAIAMVYEAINFWLMSDPSIKLSILSK